MAADNRPPDPEPLKQAAISNLLRLQQSGELTSEHRRHVAQAFGCSTKTIRNWIANAQAHNGTYTRKQRDGLRLTPQIHDALARWCGNIAAAHRELAAEGHLDIPGKPGSRYSYATLHGVITKELDPGHLAGLKGGETARRRYDVHNTRERGNRNEAWEGDHKTADVWVNFNNTPVRPHITWFADASTDGICGLAITPHEPSREAILVALRAAILRGRHHGPFGGAPGLIRIDRGKDFLCRTVAESLAAFCIRRVDLPPRRPELKGTIEAINGAVTDTFFKGLPGYTDRPTTKPGRRCPPLEDLLSFEQFIEELLRWVRWWNHEHKIRNLGNRTPAQAWEDDLTIIRDIPPEALHTFTLEPARKTFIIQGDGVHWNNSVYLDTWMNGRVGMKVAVRYMPHHDERIELTDAKTGKYLGSGFKQGVKDPDAEERRQQLHQTRQRQAATLRRRLEKTEKSLKKRYSAVTDTTPPHLLSPRFDADSDPRLKPPRDSADNPRPVPNPTSSWETTTAPTLPVRPSAAPDPSLPGPTASWHKKPDRDKDPDDDVHP
ncbi:Mu transposase C-terminal domain-containing protein [Streptomyces sp. SKN60]|uniref:Mu transposase C-terminal domain-containing protein n=1 Tax=Streptomyces sp. SKN60 TaxID=2855506 RepID=UPI002246AD41|nr:Mu transposase C-terminal domain-containing protein [Streptomyces sp. SKN60]MCX2182664.1 Mu transposase C-terminal domain-containing protein [Streptomyces sp. SKN60]